MTNTDLTRLRALDEKRTKGPWRHDDDNIWSDDKATDGNIVCEPPPRAYISAQKWADNAAFIVALENAYPGMVAEIERLRGALRQIVAEAQSDDGLTAWDGADIAIRALTAKEAGGIESTGPQNTTPCASGDGGTILSDTMKPDAGKDGRIQKGYVGYPAMVAEIERLRGEVEAMRGALQQIADYPFAGNETRKSTIARAALTAKEAGGIESIDPQDTPPCATDSAAQ